MELYEGSGRKEILNTRNSLYESIDEEDNMNSESKAKLYCEVNQYFRCERVFIPAR